jgi:23S rRNA (cytidine2498-2'-O)-methyltransferase
MLTGYLAAKGFEDVVEKELKNVVRKVGGIFFVDGDVQTSYFSQNIWYDVQDISFSSISDAATKLKQIGKLWVLYPSSFVRRGILITEKLPYFKSKPISFPSKLPSSPLGSFTLIEEGRLFAAARCLSPYAHGEVLFQETKVPPSRAYLKLWEALTLLGVQPCANDRCLEIGASPGSWTWALQQMGAYVTAVDRAPLADSLQNLDRICFLQKDAFTMKPEEVDTVDWIFSDVICYPEKLLDWVIKWSQYFPKANFVCTIKFQGAPNYEVVKEFEKIPGSSIRHLFHNKNELTWSLIRT